MKKILFALSVILSLTACSNDENITPETVIPEIPVPEVPLPEIILVEPENGFSIDKMQWLRIQPEIKNLNNATFTWSLEGKEIATSTNLIYVFAEAGTYNLEFKAKNSVSEISKKLTLKVNEKTYFKNA